MRVITVTEHERLWYADPPRPRAVAGRVEIGAADQRRLQAFDERHARGRESQQAFIWGSRYAVAKSFVGVIQVGSLCVELLPKVEEHDAAHSAQRRNLLVMLMLAGKIKMLPRDVAAQFFARAPLSEAVALIFAQDLREQLLRGLTQCYVQREEQRSSLKGKLVWSKHLRHNAARADRFYVRHEELQIDTPLNRLFLGVCRMLMRALRSRACQEALGQCAAMLDGAREEAPTLEAASRIVLDRQSERFGPALETCKMLLAQRGPAARAGELESMSLLFEMNQLYERFIAGLLRREVMPQLGPGYALYTQTPDKTHHLLREANGAQTARLEPDVFITGPAGHRVVLDTKWKRLQRGEPRDGLKVSDLYQMGMYGHCLGASQIFLLYPRPPGGVEERDYESSVQLQGSSDPVWISTRLVDLRVDLSRAEERAAIADRLADMLRAPEAEGGDEESAGDAQRRNAPRLLGMMSIFERKAPEGFILPRQNRKHYRYIINRGWHKQPMSYSGYLVRDQDTIELKLEAYFNRGALGRAQLLRQFEAWCSAGRQISGAPLYIHHTARRGWIALAIQLPLVMSDAELAQALLDFIEATRGAVDEVLGIAPLNPPAAHPTGPS